MASTFLGLESFFMAKSGSVAPASLIVGTPAHTIFCAAMTGALATHIRQSLKTHLKMRTSFRCCSKGFEKPQRVRLNAAP